MTETQIHQQTGMPVSQGIYRRYTTSFSNTVVTDDLDTPQGFSADRFLPSHLRLALGRYSPDHFLPDDDSQRTGPLRAQYIGCFGYVEYPSLDVWATIGWNIVELTSVVYPLSAH
jgi:hypothetical protein